MELQHRVIHTDVKCRHAVNKVCTNKEGIHQCGEAIMWQCCLRCPAYDGPARGIGDLVATAAKAVGIAPCGGCQKRREILNAALPLHMQRNNEISQDSAQAP